VQLHFNCVQTSEATRIDNIDSVGGNSAANVVIEDVMMMPKLVVAKEKGEEMVCPKTKYQRSITKVIIFTSSTIWSMTWSVWWRK